MDNFLLPASEKDYKPDCRQEKKPWDRFVLVLAHRLVYLPHGGSTMQGLRQYGPNVYSNNYLAFVRKKHKNKQKALKELLWPDPSHNKIYNLWSSKYLNMIFWEGEGKHCMQVGNCIIISVFVRLYTCRVWKIELYCKAIYFFSYNLMAGLYGVVSNRP